MATARFGDNSSLTMDYPGTQDTDSNNWGPNQNAGQANYMLVGSYLAHGIHRGLIAFDLESFYDDHPGATINSATLHFYVASRVG